MDLKGCLKCKRELPHSEFYVRSNGVLIGRCKECTKSDVRSRYYAKHAEVAAYERRRSSDPERKANALRYHRESNAREPEKYRARTAVGNAVRDGRLFKLPCTTCGSTEDIEAHHADYSRPLDVEWLCHKHHREHHGQITSDP
jgi:hypothetical protein